MESLCLKHLIVATQNTLPVSFSKNPFLITNIFPHSSRSSFIHSSKRSNFQDFQDYVKPSRLLPATEVESCQDSSLEKVITSFNDKTFECLYIVKLRTSSVYGSDLSDVNSGVLLCLIDENGDSILRRISPGLMNYYNSNAHHFQRGSVDEFIFEGPELGKITAVWIGLESGQWRLGGVSLTVISQQKSVSAENEKKSLRYKGFQYNYDIEDTLLGENSDMSMVELRSCVVTAISENNISLLSENSSFPSSLSTSNVSNEETMKEYADLKFSLLLYDAALTLTGSSLASFSAGEKPALAFLAGGVIGFLYLSLLQRSVDGIPSSDLVTRKSGGDIDDQTSGGLKGSVSSVILALAITVIAAKYVLGDAARVLTPMELLFGTIGFLMCKVSVVLAAFKPLPTGLRNK
nr:Lipoxygenasey domain-containing protein [Ipomoea batatas]GMD20717.1 Lipoxygenasey domain-containing protein [Ipomoea batatas]